MKVQGRDQTTLRVLRSETCQSHDQVCSYSILNSMDCDIFSLCRYCYPYFYTSTSTQQAPLHITELQSAIIKIAIIKTIQFIRISYPIIENP